MKIASLKGYKPGQLARLSLVLLILVSSFGWSFLVVRPAHAATRTSPLPTKVKPTDAGQVQFGSAAYTTTEGQAGISITVNRTGSSTGAVTATVVLTDVTTSPADYQSTFLPAGNFDPAFNSGGTGPNLPINDVAVQSDGKIVVVGRFTNYNGVLCNEIARLNTDGTLDSSFDSHDIGPRGSNPGNDIYNSLERVTIQPDGKILVAGQFASYNGVARNGLVRLNSDGTVDTSFNPATIPGAGPINAIAVQADGKILIANSLLTRLNSDGSVDSSFAPAGSGPNFPIIAVTIQADGKILVGGSFTFYSGTARPFLARLNADGTLDTSFTPAGTGPNNSVIKIALQSDGSIFIIGSFTSYNGVPSNGVARLNADGTLDNSFTLVGSGFNGQLTGLVLQSDGKLLITGLFTSYNNLPSYFLARLNPDASLDTAFTPKGNGAPNYIDGVAVKPDGKIAVSGDFTSYNGVVNPYLAQLNPNGSLDTSFTAAGTGPNNSVLSIASQADGKLLISGIFTSYNGVARNGIARLNTDGTLDTAFNPVGANTFNSGTAALAVQSDGKILVGGYFTSFNGVARNGLVRLNSDGTVDTSFNATTLSSGSGTQAIAIQSDGKILIGGYTNSNPYLNRLNSDGTLDTSFNSGKSGPNGAVNGIGVQANGKITIGGYFTSYNGVSRISIARLNPDGSLDPNFTSTSVSSNSYIYDLAVQPDGKILIVGAINLFGAYPAPYIFRLNGADSLTLSWADGDSSPRSFVITATDDTLYEPTETAQLGLTDLQGGVTAGSPAIATLSIIDNDTPAQLNLISGNNQSAVIHTAFSQKFTVQVLTQGNNPSGSVPVTFTAPASGPSGTFAGGSTVYTGTSGVGGFVTTATFTANGLAGSYTVTATAAGVVTPTTFVLTNTVGSSAISLTSSPNPSTVSNTVTFTATVNPIAASGTVTFLEGITVLGTAPLVSGTAVYTTSSLNVGSDTITAVYGGDANYTGSTSQPITQVVMSALTVFSITDDGTGVTPGTLSYALLQSQSITGSTPFTITFALTQGNTITFTGSLTTTAALQAYGVINGGTFGSSNRIIINGNGVSGDGLHLKGHNKLTNLTIEGFGARQLVLNGPGNVMQGVKVIA